MPREFTDPNGYLSDSQKALFSKNTLFNGTRQKNGTVTYSRHIVSPFREMMIGKKMQSKTNGEWSIKRFHDVRYMELPNDYTGPSRHKTKNGVKTKNTWRTRGRGAVTTLKDIREMVLQMTVSAHQMSIAFEHWRIVLAKRALKIFQDSFEMKKFNSAGEVRWKANTSWTVKKRKRRKTWPGANKLMQEYNNLYKSLKDIPTVKRFTSGVKATSKYAGYHNDPRPGDTYGDGFGGKFSPPKSIVRRQFMGHSTLIDEFINQYEKNYLYYTIFRESIG